MHGTGAGAGAACYRAPFDRRTCWCRETLRHLPDRVELELRSWHLAPRCNHGGGDHDGGLSSSGCVVAASFRARPDELHVEVDGELYLVARVLVCAEAGVALVRDVRGRARWPGAPAVDGHTLAWDARMKARGRVPTPFGDLAPLAELLQCAQLVYDVARAEAFTRAAHARLRARHAERCADALAALAPALPHASLLARVAAHMRPAWWDAESQQAQQAPGGGRHKNRAPGAARADG